jgi:hypothetical protein
VSGQTITDPRHPLVAGRYELDVGKKFKVALVVE